MSNTIKSIESSSIYAAIKNSGLTLTERTEAVAAYSLAEIISTAIAKVFERAIPAPGSKGAVSPGTPCVHRPALKV